MSLGIAFALPARSPSWPGYPEAVAVLATDAPAPDFTLASTTAGAVTLPELLRAGPAVVVFMSDECPTCELALRRLAAAAADVTVVVEAGAAAAVRFARRTGFDGRVLAQPAPYETSRAYGVEAV